MSAQTDELAAALDAEPALVPLLPRLLQDLWSLGLAPDPALRLLERSRPFRTPPRVLDLGCGKGALLIRLAEEFGWRGRGVDLMPEFVVEGRRFAAAHGVEHLVELEAGDMRAVVARGARAELVCFGVDSEALGSFPEALAQLQRCSTPGGHFLLDLAWSGDEETAALAAVREAGLRVRDSERLDPAWVAAQERANGAHIRRRADELAREYPERAAELAAYVREQEEESRYLCESAQCAWLLLTAA
jgi:SAM-dependent methyltransferase